MQKGAPALQEPQDNPWGGCPQAPDSCFPTKIKCANTIVVGKALPCLCRPHLNSEQVSLVYLFIFGTEEWLGSKPVPFSSCSLFSSLSNTPLSLSLPTHLPLSLLPQVLKIKLCMKPNTTLEHGPANALHGHRRILINHKKWIRAACPYMGRG